jgi:predicted nucleic acid-binding Zn ribbon protein
MTRAGRPRGLREAVRAARERAAPQTPLAAVQAAWPEAVGATIAAEAEPVSERDGIVRVSCRSAVWAEELDLLGPELLARLNDRLERPVTALRFSADAARHRLAAPPRPPG